MIGMWCAYNRNPAMLIHSALRNKGHGLRSFATALGRRGHHDNLPHQFIRKAFPPCSPSPSFRASPSLQSLLFRTFSCSRNSYQSLRQFTKHITLKTSVEKAGLPQQRITQGSLLCQSSVGVLCPFFATVGVGGWLWWQRSKSAADCKTKTLKNRLAGRTENGGGDASFSWKKLWVLLSEDIWYLVLAVLCAVGAAAANVQIPILLGEITNVVTRFTRDVMGDFLEEIKRPAVKLVAVYGLQALFTFSYISLLSMIGENLVLRLRQQLFTAYLQQDIAFFDTHKTGELLDRLTSDIQDFKSSFKLCVSQGLKALTQVLKVKKEYEKLQKQHQRYKKDLQRKRDQAVDDKKESEEEIRRLRERLEEQDSREKEWEHKFRGQKHEIDVLDAQNRTLMEKCEFIQQQAQTYQSQIGRRKEMQDSAEDSLKSRISQLEANVDRSTQTIVTQKEKIEKLKNSLEDAMSSHKQTMGDNEKLLTDLQKANETIQMLEERVAELEAELRSKTELLQAAQEDSQQYSQDLSRLELTLNAKDNIIKHMSDSHDFEESEQVKRLKDALQNARDDLKSQQKQRQRQTKQTLSSSSSPTTTTTTTTTLSMPSASSPLVQPSDVIMELRQDGSSPSQKGGREKDTNQNAEVHQLQLEVKKLQDKLAMVNDTHTTELTAMRQKLGEVTTELHQRNTQLASLSERSSELERSMREESDVLDKKVSELKVAQSQVDSLRSENRRLRRDLVQAEQDFNGSYSPDTQNHVMRREMNVLRNSVEDVEQIVRSQHNSARTDTSHTSLTSDRHSGSLGNTESGSERFSAMDDYLESSIRRYDDQLQFLEAQKARLEAQMSQSSRQNLRVAAEERKLHEAGSRRPPQFVYRPDESQGSEAMSLVSERQYPKVDRLELPHSSSEDELPDMAEEATQAFFEKEHEHATELERRLNAQINNFTKGMDH